MIKFGKYSIMFLLFGNLFANDLENRLLKLENRVSELEKENINLSEIVESVESKSLIDKLYFSPEIRVRTDIFDYKNRSISGVDWVSEESKYLEENYEKNYDPALSARFRLNMHYNIADETKFFGRFSIHKNSQSSEQVCILHRGIAKSSSSNATFEVDKAYIDHKFKLSNPITLSFGILPTTGGSSSNLAENRPRQSMFPSLIFDMNTYGVILTSNLKLLSDESFIRAVIAKAYTQDKDTFYYKCNREIIKNGDIVGLFFEDSIKSLGDNTIQIGLNHINKLRATPFIGTPSFVDLDNPESLGNITNYGLSLEFREILDSGFTFFLNSGLSVPNPNGKTQNYRTNATINETPLLQKGLDYAFGEMPSNNGYSIWSGALYEFKSSGTKLGFEYNMGSKYWFSATQGAEDVFNKLANRGSVYETYVIQPISKNIFIKGGYLAIDEKYTGSGWHFGEPYKKSGTQENIYLMLNAMF